MASVRDTPSLPESGRLAQRLRAWVRELEGSVLADLTGPLMNLAPVVWILTFLLPKDGFRADLCQFHQMTGVCCFGCGLTRSFTCISHLDFAAAWHYHPFGFVGYALMVLLTVRLLLPRRVRQLLGERLGRRRKPIAWSILALSAAFILFGLGRMVAGVSL